MNLSKDDLSALERLIDSRLKLIQGLNQVNVIGMPPGPTGYFVHQPINAYVRGPAAAPPTVVVQDVWYPVFDLQTYRGVELYTVSYKHVNDTATAKNIELKFTYDGIVCVGSIAALANNTTKYPSISSSADTIAMDQGFCLWLGNSTVGALFRTRTAKMEIRTTSVPGTNQNLYCTTRQAVMR
jgi:hypothetical protein